MSLAGTGAANPATAIALKVGSVTAFVAMASFIKAAGPLPPGQIVFFRSAFAIPAILIWLIWRGQFAGAFATARPLGHVARGLVGVSAMGLGFFGLTRLPLPDAITLGYAKPLLVVAFSALFLGERVRLFRWTAVIVGLVGVFVISWPKLQLIGAPGGLSDQSALGVMAVLASATLAACAMLITRSLVRTEATATIVIWFSATASVAALATLPLGWAPMAFATLALLVAAGVCGGLGQVMLTQSYRHAEISTIAPFEYVSMLLSVAIGYAVFAEVPTAWTLSGGAIVVAAGIFIIFREHRLGLERGAARKVQPPN